MATLLDHRGKPVELRSLTKEVATATQSGIRTPWLPGVATGLTPQKLARILRDAKEGVDYDEYLTLAEEMLERDPHFYSVVQTRKLGITGLEWGYKTPRNSTSDDGLAEEFLAEVVDDPGFADALNHLLDGLVKGYAAVEIVWERGANHWKPKALIDREPHFFTFDRDTGRELRLRDESAQSEGLALKPFKWIVHMPALKSGRAIRSGLAMLCAAMHMCKSYGTKDWMAFAEVFGLPMRIGKVGPDATRKQVNDLRLALSAMASDAVGIIPASCSVELLQAVNGSSPGDFFERLAGFCDKQVSKAVLGQTMTTDDGSSMAQAKIHENVRIDILTSDARKIGETITRDLFIPWVILNHGPQKAYSKIHPVIPQEEDLELLAKALIPFIDRGLKVPAASIREKFGLEEPAAGEEVLGPMAKGSEQSGHGKDDQEADEAAESGKESEKAEANAAASARDDIDDLMAEIDDWHRLVDGIISPIEAAAERSISADDFKANLKAALAAMDVSALHEKLAVEIMKAKGLGDHEDAE